MAPLEHPGVYRVGHRAPSVKARYLAAILACGERAVLCCRAAAYLQGLIKAGPPPAEVMAPVKGRLRGGVTHRVRRIDARDTTVWRGIPITDARRRR